MKAKIAKFAILTMLLALSLLYVAKFAGPRLLKLYIETGIGDCQKIPVLCTTPEEEIYRPVINKQYIEKLLPYKFATIKIQLPKGFTVVNEKVTKVYYKKKKIRQYNYAVCHLFHQPPGYFVNLFPQLKKQNVRTDYDFIHRLMYTNLNKINSITDAFFVITKSVLTASMGNQKNLKIIKFSLNDTKGFVVYNLTKQENNFDCSIFNERGDFFKVFIKDKGANLDLEKVFSIISTVRK